MAALIRRSDVIKKVWKQIKEDPRLKGRREKILEVIKRVKERMERMEGKKETWADVLEEEVARAASES